MHIEDATALPSEGSGARFRLLFWIREDSHFTGRNPLLSCHFSTPVSGCEKATLCPLRDVTQGRLADDSISQTGQSTH